MTELRTALAQLFRETGQAHHRAFAATDGDDPDWPDWYAQQLAAPLSALLGVSLGAENLAGDLRGLDRQMKAEAPTAEWTVYYADWFLARHSSHAAS